MTKFYVDVQHGFRADSKRVQSGFKADVAPLLIQPEGIQRKLPFLKHRHEIHSSRVPYGFSAVSVRFQRGSIT